MDKLNLELFIRAASDPEYSKYKLLAIMKKHLEYLHHSKLYPVFSNLIEISALLRGILENRSSIENSFPKKLLRFDLENKKPIFNTEELFGADKDSIFDFIDWSMPQIQEALNEGKAIYDFVEQNSEIREIGIIPLYKNEGYLFISDIKNKELKIYRYETVLFSSETEPLRTLKTKYLETLPLESFAVIKREIKIELTHKYPELPNPAVYLFQSEIDFPFKETILPIAKRKLMKTLAA